MKLAPSIKTQKAMSAIDLLGVFTFLFALLFKSHFGEIEWPKAKQNCSDCSLLVSRTFLQAYLIFRWPKANAWWKKETFSTWKIFSWKRLFSITCLFLLPLTCVINSWLSIHSLKNKILTQEKKHKMMVVFRLKMK